jgi:predicted phage terminase large subunit-like protein
MLLGIIDDPVKSRAEAESETFRRGVWNWYVSDFRTRAMGDQGAIVLVCTRWHTDDLAGRLLAQAAKEPAADQWKVVSLPAVLEREAPGDPRRLDEALWPSRFSRAYLEATRVSSGIYDWSALYQQEPVPPGGAMAQRSWFKIGPPRGNVRRKCRCWDLAATKPTHGRDPDWTVGTLVAEHTDGTWTVEHVVRLRDTPGEVDKVIAREARQDGRHVLIAEWLDPGAAGKAVIEAHRRMLPGYDFEALPSSGEKSTRWRPFFQQAEAGNVYLVDGAWNRDWLDEIQVVPFGGHDDQADSAVGAFKRLTELKDYGPQAGVIMPDVATVSGPRIGSWREEFFRR